MALPMNAISMQIKLLVRLTVHARACRLDVARQRVNFIKPILNPRLCAEQLRQRDVRQSLLDDVVQADDDGTNAAVARVYASVEHARVALAVAGNRAFVEHLDDLAQMYRRRRAREPVAALRAANGFDEAGLV